VKRGVRICACACARAGTGLHLYDLVISAVGVLLLSREAQLKGCQAGLSTAGSQGLPAFLRGD